MRPLMRRLLAFLLTVVLTAPAAACEWDYDTLRMEREQFPGTLELIVGKFLRHSDTFYEWRVKDRTAKIAAAKSGVLMLEDEELARVYDDLAVAYDKLGQHDQAIETIREKAERLPNVGQYETHANLGTFLVHAGRYEEGLVELNKAIEINPDAHFGREKYQVLLVEYLMEKRGGDGELTLPLNADAEARYSDYGGPFAHWLLEKQGLYTSEDAKVIEEEMNRATKGLLGMMRFGNFHSPILLEAVGDLLLFRHDGPEESVQGQRLAARAYLRAAQFAEPEQAKTAYRELANHSLLMQHPDKKTSETWATERMGLSLASLEDQLAREVKEAGAWFSEVVEDEELWVEASPDPDRRFWEKYGGQVIQVGHDRLPAGKFTAAGLPWWIRVGLGAGFVVTALVVVGALLWRRKRPTGYNVREREPV